MHIAIDARSIFTGGGGDRTYFRNVIQEMAKLSPQDRWTLYADSDDSDRDSLRAPNVTIAPALPARVGALWNMTRLVPQLRRDKADLLHAQYTLPPLGPVPCPMLVTIHDATFRIFPSWFPRRANRVQNLLIPQAARRAARVLTGSQSAASDIHRSMQIPSEKIFVTPYGLDERFHSFPVVDQDNARQRYNLPASYIFGVGLLRLRKNVTVVLQAVSRLLARGEWPDRCVLALTGGWKGLPQAAAYRAEHPEIDGVVRVLGYVPDDDLPLLYAGAMFSVYPSLYEGFGFPVLESMACGCPVISSDTSSLPEVVGTAGISLAPEDVDGWTTALLRLLRDEHERETLRQAGFAQAATFTWERTARETLAVYHEVAEQGL